MIVGDALAPWEDGEAAQLHLRPLGIFKPAVLGLLHRDPLQRTAIHKFLAASKRSLGSTSMAEI